MTASSIVSTLLNESPARTFPELRAGLRATELALKTLLADAALPDDIREDLTTLLARVSKYDSEKLKLDIGHKVGQMKGPTLSKVEVHSALQKILGRGWTTSYEGSLVDFAASESEDADGFLPDPDVVGLQADPLKCSVVAFERPPDDEEEDGGGLTYARFILMPGHVYIEEWGNEHSAGEGAFFRNNQLGAELRKFA